MAVNLQAYVGWGFIHAATAKIRANLFSSWGLLETSSSPTIEESKGTWINLCLTMFP